MLRKVSEVPVRIFGSARAAVREAVGQRRASTAAAPRPKLNVRPNPLIPSQPPVDPMSVGVAVETRTKRESRTISEDSTLFNFERSSSNRGSQSQLLPLDTARLSVIAALLEASHSLRLCDCNSWEYIVIHNKTEIPVAVRLENDNFITTLNGEELVIPRSAVSRSELERLVNLNASNLRIHGRGVQPAWNIGLNGEEYEFKIYTSHVAASLSLMPTPKPPVIIKDIHSPLAGVVTHILVKEGDRVVKGQKICVLEAMKMQNDLVAAGNGVVVKLLADVGKTVGDGELLVKID